MFRKSLLCALFMLCLNPTTITAAEPVTVSQQVIEVLEKDEVIEFFKKGGPNVARGVENVPDVLGAFMEAEKTTGTPWEVGLGVCLSEGLKLGSVNYNDPNGGSFGLCQLSLANYKAYKLPGHPEKPDPTDHYVMAEVAMVYMKEIGLDQIEIRNDEDVEAWKQRFMGPQEGGGARWNNRRTQANAAYFAVFHLRNMRTAFESEVQQ